MNNLDRYYDESRKYEDNRKCFFFQKRTGLPCCDDTYNCKHCFENTIKWLLQDYEGSILTEEEKQHCGYNDELKGQDVIYTRIENPKYPSLVTAGMYFFTTYDLQFARIQYILHS